MHDYAGTSALFSFLLKRTFNDLLYLAMHGRKVRCELVPLFAINQPG